MKAALSLAVAAVVAGGGAVALALGSGAGGASGAATPAPTGLARVVRTDLVAQQAIPGTIGYDGALSVYAPIGVAAQSLQQARQALVGDEVTATSDQTALGDTAAGNAVTVSQQQGSLQDAQAVAGADRMQAAQDQGAYGTDAQALTAALAKQATDQSQFTADTNAQRAEQEVQLSDQQQLGAGQAELTTDQAGLGAATQALAADRQASAAQAVITHDEQAVANATTAVSNDEAAVAAAQQRLNAEAIALQHDGFALADDTGAVQADTAAVTADRAAVTADQAKVQADAEKTSLSDPAAVSGATASLAVAQAAASRALHQAQAKLAADAAAVQAAEASLAVAERAQTGVGTTVTWLPPVGRVINEGDPVYAVDGVPVPLLYGQVPLFRELGAGVTDGPDVSELSTDLGLGASAHFSTTTAAALQRWQGAHGLPATGSLALGQVVVEPGPLRVGAVHAAVGAQLGTGAVLDATSPDVVVTAQVPINDLGPVHPGDAVRIDLPDGRTGAGRVRDIGTSVTPPANTGQGGGGSATSVPATVTFSDPTLARGLDQAAVLVHVTTQTANGVLAVPVEALLALSSGGEGVEVVSGGAHRVVPVTTGLFSGTQVEVDGQGLTEGAFVVVPTP